MGKIIVQLNGVCYRNGKTVLSNVSLSVNRGKCCAIIGPNGSGKSTLIAIIAGYLWPSSGSVTVLGQTYGMADVAKIREQIGLITPSRIPEFEHRTPARDIVAAGLFGTIVIPPHKTISRWAWQKVDKEIASVGLKKQAANPFGRLSTGEQMRILIARAMVSRPKLLILDEPTAGLDMGTRVAVIKSLENLLRRKNAPTLIVVSHHLDELPYPLEQVVLLKNGRVFAQGTAEQTLTSRNLSRVFDCPVDVISDKGRFSTKVNHKEWKI